MFISDNPTIAQDLAKKYGYLPYMVDRYIQFLGIDGTKLLLEANEKPLPPYIRTNTLKINPDQLRERLEIKGFQLEPLKWVPDGFKITVEPLNLGSLHEFLQGLLYIQNLASMLPPLILNPNPDDIVIDMCAAPGGKATHLAQIMNNKGKLILIDRNLKRIPALEINIKRMGIINTIVINMDASNISKLNLKADKILLDAPCTGEGLISEDPSRKKSKSLEDIYRMAGIQKRLLQAGLDALNPEGLLLYCTCSIAPEENEIVINSVLENEARFKIKKIKKQYGVEGYNQVFGKSLKDEIKLSQRLYPHHHQTIGFFFCLIERIT